MSIGQSEALLHDLAGTIDRFAKAPSEIMGGGEAHIEERILRIVRTHAHGLFQMRDRLVRLAIKGKGPAKIAVTGGEIRVQVDGAPELLNRLLGVTPRECHYPEC